MKKKLRLIVSFDIHDEHGNSVLDGDYNAVGTMMGVGEVTSSDIAALNGWLQILLGDLWKGGLTSGLMPPRGQAQAAQNGNTGDKPHPPSLIYENFHTQTTIDPAYLEYRRPENDKP